MLITLTINKFKKGKTMKRKNTSILKPTVLNVEAERRYQELLRIRKEVEERLLIAPPGKIHIVNSGTRTQFYLRKDASERSGKYIRKTEADTIRKHLQKRYDEEVLKLVNTEIDRLEQFLKKSQNLSDMIRQTYSNYPVTVKSYISPIDLSDKDFLEEWQNIPYQKKEISDYVPMYETNRKERVRSKSELAIANMLAEKEIPYKYECPLILQNGITIYPDFTVMHIASRKEIYWEHRGMMDDRDYARRAVFKLRSMMKNGLVLWDNLIITEETSANPLGTNEIEMVINTYFC